MKLRSGLTYGIMNTQGFPILESVSSLKELYKEGENLMTCCDNANYLKELLVKVNQAYDAFSSLSAHLSGNDIISSDLGTKLDVDTGYWEFKQRVQEWFDDLPSSSPVVLETMTTSAQVGDKQIGSSLPLNWQVSDSLASSNIQTLVLNYSCFPSVSSTADLFRSNVGCPPGFSAPHSLTTFSDIQYVQAHGQSVRDTIKALAPTSVVPSTLQNQQTSLVSKDKFFPSPLPSIKRGSRGSRRSSASSSSSASRLQRARVKLELARLEKRQNEEKLREEEKIAAAEAELDRERAAAEAAADAELKRKKAELHRMKVKAEDERRIKAAELEAALYRSLIDTEDDLSSDDGKPVAPQFQTGTKANCVTYSSNDRVRFNDQTFKVCINSDVVTSFAASHTVSASEFGRLKANDRNQGPFVKETSCHKLASYCGPRISEVTHPPTQPIPSQIYERSFQVSRQHPSVHSAYDALRGSTDQLLPTPSIRKFDGDPLDYWAFYNRFRCHVADWLPSKKKLSYLLQHCTAEVSQYIQHFADVHESNHHVYDLAWDELRRRYGQSYIIAQACQEKLLSFPKIDRDVAERLNKLNILVKKSCFALGNENVSSSLDLVQFLTALATKLPLDLKRKWVENTVQISKRYGRIASFEDFAVFVEEQARVANSVFGLKLFQSSSRNDVSSKPKASAFHTVVNKTRIDVKCQCCSEPHYVYQCRKFRSLSVEERWSIVMKQGLRKLCLHSGHFAARCTLSLRCKKKDCGSTAHKTLLHLVSKGSEAQSSTNQPTTSEESQVKSLATSSRMSNTLQGRGTYLDVVPVKVFTKDETIQTYALLDSGSDRSFCEARLIRELNIRGSPVKMSIQTMSPSNPHVMDCSLVQLQVPSMNDDHCMNLNEVVVVDSIRVAPSFVPVEQMMQCPHLCDVSLPSIKDATVTLLIETIALLRAVV